MVDRVSDHRGRWFWFWNAVGELTWKYPPAPASSIIVTSLPKPRNLYQATGINCGSQKPHRLTCMVHQALIAVQAVTNGEQLASAIAFVTFLHSLGPAVILVLCNVIFLSSLTSQLKKEAVHADIEAIIGAGATGFRRVVQPADLQAILAAYANSIDKVFYLVAAVAAACLIVL